MLTSKLVFVIKNHTLPSTTVFHHHLHHKFSSFINSRDLSSSFSDPPNKPIVVPLTHSSVSCCNFFTILIVASAAVAKKKSVNY